MAVEKAAEAEVRAQDAELRMKELKVGGEEGTGLGWSRRGWVGKKSDGWAEREGGGWAGPGWSGLDWSFNGDAGAAGDMQVHLGVCGIPSLLGRSYLRRLPLKLPRSWPPMRPRCCSYSGGRPPTPCRT